MLKNPNLISPNMTPPYPVSGLSQEGPGTLMTF